MAEERREKCCGQPGGAARELAAENGTASIPPIDALCAEGRHDEAPCRRCHQHRSVGMEYFAELGGFRGGNRPSPSQRRN